MQMSARRVLAAGLALLVAAPGPAFAGQVVGAAVRSGSAAVPGGTMGLGQSGAGASLSVSRGALLSPALQGASLLGAPSPVSGLQAAVLLPAQRGAPPAVWKSVRPAPAPTVRNSVPSVPAEFPIPQAEPPIPPAAAASVQEAQKVLAETSGPQLSGEAASPVSSKSSWDSFWTRSRAPASVEASAPGSESSPSALPAAQPTAKAKTEVPSPKAGRLRKLSVPLGAAALWAGAHFSGPARAAGFLGKAAPYLSGAGFLLAAHALDGLAHRGVDLLAKRLKWQPGTVMAARLASSVLVYAAGGALALHAAGVSTAALLATFGIGGVAMTMAAKEFIGNFLEGVKMLLNRPFSIGDRIKIGDRAYTVDDMDLRYLTLKREDGGQTMMTYSQLSEKMVTVLRGYEAGRSAKGLLSLWSDMSRLVKDLPKPSILKASLWTAAGVGLAVALPFLPALAPIHALASAPAWLPYLKGGMTMLAAHFLQKGAVGFIRRLAEARGWTPQQAVVVKLAVQLGVYLVGGTTALHFFGMNWGTLLKSLGATSIAVGWASADIIGNLIQGFWILATHPFSVGDRLEVGAVTGVVADMNISYVVLSHEDDSHTLVPYAVLKASPFTVLSKAPHPDAK